MFGNSAEKGIKMKLRELYNYIESLGIKYFENGKPTNHWVLSEELKAKKMEILRNIFCFLGKSEVKYKYYTIRKNKNCFCQNSLCVHPDCYTIVPKGSNKTGGKTEDFLMEDDIIEYSKEINLEDYHRLGKDEFLERFNETQPAFLKITKTQLKQIITYMENNDEKIHS